MLIDAKPTSPWLLRRDPGRSVNLAFNPLKWRDSPLLRRSGAPAPTTAGVAFDFVGVLGASAGRGRRGAASSLLVTACSIAGGSAARRAVTVLQSPNRYRWPRWPRADTCVKF